jgi:hypothetical protein
MFRDRIRRGIALAIQGIINQEPDEHAPANFTRSAATVASIPNYWGRNDLVVFMRWLQNFIVYLDIQQLVGRSNDTYRLKAL